MTILTSGVFLLASGQLSDPETTLMPAQIDVWLHRVQRVVSPPAPLPVDLLARSVAISRAPSTIINKPL